MATSSINKSEIVHEKTVLFEHSDQALAPSKNYINVVVNKSGVIFRVWKINPGVSLIGRVRVWCIVRRKLKR